MVWALLPSLGHAGIGPGLLEGPSGPPGLSLRWVLGHVSCCKWEWMKGLRVTEGRGPVTASLTIEVGLKDKPSWFAQAPEDPLDPALSVLKAGQSGKPAWPVTQPMNGKGTTGRTQDMF